MTSQSPRSCQRRARAGAGLMYSFVALSPLWLILLPTLDRRGRGLLGRQLWVGFSLPPEGFCIALVVGDKEINVVEESYQGSILEAT